MALHITEKMTINNAKVLEKLVGHLKNKPKDKMTVFAQMAPGCPNGAYGEILLVPEGLGAVAYSIVLPKLRVVPK